MAEPDLPVKPEALSRRVVRGSAWVFSLRALNQALYFIKLIVLARLVAPGEFGLLGVAMLTMAILETFTQTGVMESLIQKKEDAESFLDTAWTILVVRGAFLFALVFALAPLAASFFAAPRATWVIRVFGLSVAVGAVNNIGVVFFQKELDFRRQFLYQASNVAVNFLATMGLAFLLRNVWALVIGALAGNAAQSVVGFLIHPYRPKLKIDRRKAGELIGFGKWVFLSSILVFLATQGDDILVGKILGVAALGFYQMAYKVSNTPTTEVTHALAQVLFPAFAKLQDDLRGLRQAYLKVLQLIAFLSFPLAGLVYILGPDFTRLILGPRWLPMVPALQTLALAGLIRALLGSTGPLFYGIGKPKTESFLELGRFLVMAVLIYPLTVRWQLLGASLAVLASVLVSSIGFTYFALRFTRCPWREWARSLALPLLKTVAVGLAVAGMKAAWGCRTIGGLIWLTASGMILYGLLTWLLEKTAMRALLSTLRDGLGLGGREGRSGQR